MAKRRCDYWGIRQTHQRIWHSAVHFCLNQLSLIFKVLVGENSFAGLRFLTAHLAMVVKKQKTKHKTKPSKKTPKQTKPQSETQWKKHHSFFSLKLEVHRYDSCLVHSFWSPSSMPIYNLLETTVKNRLGSLLMKSWDNVLERYLGFSDMLRRACFFFVWWDTASCVSVEG